MNQNTYLLTIWGILITPLFGCNCFQQKDAPPNTMSVEINSADKKDTLNSAALISSLSEFVSEYGPAVFGYSRNRAKFIRPYCSSKYAHDTLIVTTLQAVNECGTEIGKIEFSNDSLFLLTEFVDSVGCSSEVLKKYTYFIVKEDIKKYHIVY
ncbi:MAG: hypothetical protein F9K23_07510 [Bacteroidetes bacterium]|nr:MAG: hypothetical protein F9K23_07510 [Bacteroidota bacterium]